MSEYRPLDGTADVLPVGLQPTPFGEVWQALQQVAAQVWDVDPSVYRAGIAWLWYALRNPAALDADGLRPLLVAALISEQAPMVKDWQTASELAEYLRLWRDYTPTYPKLEALYSVFAARVEVRPISDAESQGVMPVDDRRLAFYLRVENFDPARALSLDEVYQIAVRATPLGSRPIPYLALVGGFDVFAGPASAGMVRALWASEPAAAPPMSFVVVDSTTGAIVHGFNQELTTYELPSVALTTPNVVIGVPMSGPVQAFWFTDNGRDETSDKTFTVVGNPLFDEDGSVARNELYDSAVPLSFMQHDGNMFEADSDIVRYLPVTDRLVLSIPGDSTTRDKSAWSVQLAKLFVLSYANTQLPDVQIDLPINEVGTYGTSITLPTIDGEYESGGKTWKPSAWDIGAFGSSYTLNADTVAHLVFEEVQQYQEITLYMQSGSKAVQRGVTSGYTEDVVSGFCYQLYTDEACTIPWKGYDYSNDYEIGYYAGGEFVRYAHQSILDLPDAITYEESESKVALILLDTCYLWMCSNYTLAYNQSIALSQITLRIYPKAQQHYAAYVYGSSKYENAYVGISSSKTCVNMSESLNYIQTPHQFPYITLQKILGAAGNEYPIANYSTYQGADGTRFRIRNNIIESNIRTVVYTLEYPTFYHWLKSDGTNISTSSGVSYPVMSLGGEIIEIDNNYDYFPIGLIQYNGDWASSTYSYLNNATMGAFDPDHPTWLCFKQVSGTLTMSCVWYYKKPKSQ